MSVKTYNRVVGGGFILFIISGIGIFVINTEPLLSLNAALFFLLGGFLGCSVLADKPIKKLQEQLTEADEATKRAETERTKFHGLFNNVASFVEGTLDKMILDNDILSNLISFVDGLNRQIRLLETEKQRLEQELAKATAELEVQREFAAAVVKPAGKEATS